MADDKHDDSPAKGIKKQRWLGNPRQRAYLRAYCKTLNHGRAAKAAGVHRLTHYRWLREDERYKEQFSKALKIVGDKLEEEAMRRAKDGTRKLVLERGKPVFVWYDAAGHVVEEGHPSAMHKKPLYEHAYSDRLLAPLLAAAKPRKYKQRQEVTHKGSMALSFDGKEDKLKRINESLSELRAKGQLPSLAPSTN